MQSKIQARIQHKHDIEVNWLKAQNFVPLQGEFIVYDIEVDSDGSILELPEGRTIPYSYERFKIGDGKTVVSELAFVDEPILAQVAEFFLKKEDAYNDEEVRSLISSNATAISAEETRAKDIEESLQNQINTIVDNPDTEGIINSINEFTVYITEHGTLAEGFRADIDKNKEDIAELQAKKTIIDVVTLPTNNIDTNATYRLIKGAFLLSNIVLYDSTCIIKENTDFLNESGLSLVEKHDDAFAYTGYYCVSNNTAYGYIDKQKIKDALDYSSLSFTEKMAIEAALLSINEGWTTMAEIAQSLLSESINLKWGSIVTAISEMSDPDSLYIYLFEELFSYKNGNWVSQSFQVGRPGLVAGAEIFNDFSNVASGILSHAEGNKTSALGSYSHSEGNETVAEGYVSHAEGGFTSALGEYSHTEGYMTEASGDRSHAEGANTLASNSSAHAEGSETKATASTSHAEGYSTEASGSSSHAEGDRTTASGAASHTEGSMTTASETGAHAEGGSTTAEAAWSHAEGYGTTTSGNSSHAEGQNTTSSGTAAHAEGMQTQAVGEYSHAEGALTDASGQAAHAEGENTKATANAAHAEGYNTEASNVYAHAEGALTVASATGAHAEGGSTKATEAWAHAEGYDTKATGNSSHAGGMGTIAAGEAQTVIGRYNLEDNTKAFIIGGGVNNGYGYLRKNVTTVDWSGNAEFAGNITSNGNLVVTEADIEDVYRKGPGITAVSPEQMVIGRYNKEEVDKLFIIGNGRIYTTTTPPISTQILPKNAHTVDLSGNAWYSGDIKVGGESYDDENAQTLATQEFVINLITNLCNKLNEKGIEISITDLLGMAEE